MIYSVQTDAAGLVAVNSTFSSACVVDIIQPDAVELATVSSTFTLDFSQIHYCIRGATI